MGGGFGVIPTMEAITSQNPNGFVGAVTTGHAGGGGGEGGFGFVGVTSHDDDSEVFAETCSLTLHRVGAPWSIFFQYPQ